MMATYRAQVSRGERMWLVHVPEIERTTQARHLREVDAMARDLIAVMTGDDPDGIDLTVTIELPESVRSHLRRSAQLREQAAGAQSEAAGEARAAALELRQAGLPVRDIGQALGVSYQRAHQLIST